MGILISLHDGVQAPDLISRKGGLEEIARNVKIQAMLLMAFVVPVTKESRHPDKTSLPCLRNCAYDIDDADRRMATPQDVSP